MGPAGAGKTTLGSALALHLGMTFIDGDGLHPAANIEKMRRGEALADEDRAPWLDRIAAVLQDHLKAGKPVILACSALKKRYRDRLRRSDPAVGLVCVNAPQHVLQERAASRSGHFMPVQLVADQCAQLELPAAGESALLLDGTMPVDALLREVQVWLAARDRRGA